MSDEFKDKHPAPRPAKDGSDPTQNPDAVELSLRFLVGLLSIGGDEVARRLQDMHGQLEDDPSLWDPERSPADKSLSLRAWYLGVGLIKRGQKRLRSSLTRGFEFVLGAADRAAPSTRLPSPLGDALEGG